MSSSTSVNNHAGCNSDEMLFLTTQISNRKKRKMKEKKRKLTTNRVFNESVKFYFHFKFSDFPHWLSFHACAFLNSLVLLVAYCSGDLDPSLNAELEASHTQQKTLPDLGQHSNRFGFFSPFLWNQNIKPIPMCLRHDLVRVWAIVTPGFYNKAGGQQTPPSGFESYFTPTKKTIH